MKTFLGFGTCFRPPVPTTLPRRDETRFFLSGQRNSYNGSNWVCSSSSSSSSSSSTSSSSSSSSSSTAQWQPTLLSISEDNVVSVVVEKAEEEATRFSKKVPRKTASTAIIGVRTTYTEYFRFSCCATILKPKKEDKIKASARIEQGFHNHPQHEKKANLNSRRPLVPLAVPAFSPMRLLL